MVLLMCTAGAFSNLVICEYSIKSQFRQLRDKLTMIAHAAALRVDADTLLKIPLDKGGENTPQYKIVEKKLLEVKKIAPSLAYIYILKATKKKGIFRFLIDIKSGRGSAKRPPAYPGQGYDGGRFPEMLKAFSGPSADKTLAVDEWGAFLSGYAPVRDKNGNVAAILGIDMSAQDVYNVQKEVRRRAIAVFILAIVFSAVLGILVSRRITAPVKKLSEGARRIAAGDLRYRVKVGGADEISELAKTFNEMAASLGVARQKFLNYFYRVVQSFIRILEARDPYIGGHSDRVAGYSEKIAAEMGLPEKKTKLLKEAALLHDIGKLGIQEMILNKKGSLDEEERRRMQKHPLIGEDILKPVSPDKELLKVIRNHHERYDGKGYPDGLNGEEVDILAAIVAVADSYDAMTTDRAYRFGLSREEVIGRLKKNKGTQFNPAVVDAFIRVLRKEK